MLEFLMTIYCKYTEDSSSEKICKFVKICQSYDHDFVASLLAHPVHYGTR